MFSPSSDTPSDSASEAFALWLASRRSVRGFLPEAVAPDVLSRMMVAARRAPSGANLQPGRFWAVQGGLRQRLSDALVEAWRRDGQEAEDYAYFPEPLPMGLRKRQAASAQALYGALGVARGDAAGRAAQFERNYRFFDAPVAIIVTIDRDFGPGGYMDLGMALYGLMLAARAEGLDSCAIGAMASFPRLIRETLGLDAQQAVVCGVAIGRADPLAPANGCETVRCAEEDYFQVLGGD
ncbi:nitroreductase [Variovorax sp. HJSM1_2]|uniref:nitroreductase n=1 Tax=Variovorax sp. HJSM1_2 TaxID=3366263 RepID=UPI003BE26D57